MWGYQDEAPCLGYICRMIQNNVIIFRVYEKSLFITNKIHPSLTVTTQVSVPVNTNCKYLTSRARALSDAGKHAPHRKLTTTILWLTTFGYFFPHFFGMKTEKKNKRWRPLYITQTPDYSLHVNHTKCCTHFSLFPNTSGNISACVSKASLFNNFLWD